MTIAITMLAPNAAAYSSIEAQSGITYTSDAYGYIKNVPANDVLSLLAADCITLGILGARSNLTATTNPGVSNDNTQDYAVGSHWLNKNTGVEYVATSVATGAASWTSINGSYLGLPWVTGQFYGNPGGATIEALLTVLGTMYAYPVFIPSTVTLSSLNMGVTTGQTGGKVRCALYADTGAGYPGALVSGTDSGDLAATATAVGTKGSLAVAITPGWYWAASQATASSTMPSVDAIKTLYTGLTPTLLGYDTAAHALTTSGQAATGISVTGQTYGAMPSTFPASATLTLAADTPMVALGV